MNELTDGARVRHPSSADDGTVIRRDDRVWVKWDSMCPPSDIYPGGSVEPEDLEIIPGGEDS